MVSLAVLAGARRPPWFRTVYLQHGSVHASNQSGVGYLKSRVALPPSARLCIYSIARYNKNATLSNPIFLLTRPNAPAIIPVQGVLQLSIVKTLCSLFDSYVRYTR